ncbi:MAG: hypothetical protein OHK0012_16480 [Synechococcales cyanobacterium]
MHNLPPSQKPTPPTEEVDLPRPKPSLREALQGIELDILQELEAFRAWQQQQITSDQLPANLIEDLDEDEPDRFGWVSHTLLLFSVWVASCAGLIVGLWWLFNPGSPNQVRRVPQPPLIRVNLAELPLVPPLDVETVPIIPWIELATLPLIPEVDLEALLAAQIPTPTPTLTPSPTPTPTAVAATPVPDPTALFRPPITPDQVSVSPNQSEGTFIVVISYDGETTLASARRESPGAFIKTIAGQQYVQMASFQQVEYARFLAEELRQKGFNALISQS